MPAEPMWRPSVRNVVWLLVTVAAIGIMVTSVRAYAVESFEVPSGSMYPTLQVGDRIIVNKLSSTVKRGDIVVFRRAPGDHDPEYQDLVKRVIGLPGETISSAGDTVLIDGSPLAEPWLPKLTGDCHQSAFNIPVTKIPPGQYFVMGDCRGDSDDSRYWGTVPKADIIGKVTAVLWRNNHPWVHWF